MYHAPIIISTVFLASCAVSNASNSLNNTNTTNNIVEIIECPVRVCTNIHVDSDVYRGTHILSVSPNTLEDSLLRF